MLSTGQVVSAVATRSWSINAQVGGEPGGGGGDRVRSKAVSAVLKTETILQRPEIYPSKIGQ